MNTKIRGKKISDFYWHSFSLHLVPQKGLLNKQQLLMKESALYLYFLGVITSSQKNDKKNDEKSPKNLEWTCERAMLSFCAKQKPICTNTKL